MSIISAMCLLVGAYSVSRFAKIVFNKIDQMDIKIGFEMSLVVVEAIRGRCASCTVLTATVWDIFGGQINSSILVLGQNE